MLVAVFASVAISYLILETFSQGIGDIGLVAAIVAPLVLGGPMVFYMSLKHHELELAYQRLEAAAARDSLTNCFHHGAFVEAVTTHLSREDIPGGALLVVDADHFKSINDRFGHASGDTALKLIVASIRAVIRPHDVLGRLGGEEFGVFLPGATMDQARAIADTIRLSVKTIEFDAGEQTCMLSVSIGGGVFADRIQFNELFRIADARLYKVKQSGRNATDIVMVPPRPANQAQPQLTELVYRGQRVMR